MKATDIQNEALWEFPCQYPIKIMGLANEPMTQIVTDIVCRHVAEFDSATLELRASSGGKYVSITASLYIERKEQINGLYADLAACPQIKFVL